MKFGYIFEQHNQYPVQTMCQVLEVSKSGYYAWRQRGESTHAQEDRELLGEIERIHEDSGNRYGSPRVWQVLRKAGRKHSRKRVARLMVTRGLFARKKRRFVHTTQADPTHVPSANLLARDFHAAQPNRKWVSDIKQIPTEEGDLYIAVHLDLYSRKVVGWAMEDNMESALTIQSMRMALQQRQPEPNLLTHSDRGSQYSAEFYRAEPSQRGCQQNMSRKGNVCDNAAMESFFPHGI